MSNLEEVEKRLLFVDGELGRSLESADRVGYSAIGFAIAYLMSALEGVSEIEEYMEGRGESD